MKSISVYNSSPLIKQGQLGIMCQVLVKEIHPRYERQDIMEI